jgi:hypothetical protein
VVDAARHVLPACGLVIAGPSADPPHECESGEVLAGIAITGDALRGMLALAAPAELFYAAYPLPLPERGRPEPLALDWAGEIVNRLVGRIKHALSLRGVVIGATTPRTSLGDPLRASRVTDGTLLAVAFPVAGLSVRVWLHASTAEGLALPAPPCAVSALLEGDVLLFD